MLSPRDDIWLELAARKAPPDAVWLDEGSAWFRRNRMLLGGPAMLGYDWPLRLVNLYSLAPRTIVEIGCSNGWRLAVLSEGGRRECIGLDASSEALIDGQARYPKLKLYHALATSLPIRDYTADLVIISYLYHWLARESLLLAASEVDRILKPGSYLILADFAPDVPTRVSYHHRAGLWTWKLPDAYAGLFLATGVYREVTRITYNHDGHDDRADIDSDRRGACVLLRKESQYR